MHEKQNVTKQKNTMNKNKNGIPKAADSLAGLQDKIQSRERKIESHCLQVAVNVQAAVSLAFEQGDDLGSAAKDLGQHEFVSLINGTFGQCPKRAYDYIKLSEKVPAAARVDFFDDCKLLKGAMKILDLLPEESAAIAQPKPATTIPPVFKNLVWLAEWATRNGDEVERWDECQRKELKQQLAPVVGLYQRL